MDRTVWGNRTAGRYRQSHHMDATGTLEHAEDDDQRNDHDEQVPAVATAALLVPIEHEVPSH
jgi:hypothetical protein